MQQQNRDRSAIACLADRTAPSRSGIGGHGAHVTQAETRHHSVAIAQRLAEQLAGIEEQDRRVPVDLGDLTPGSRRDSGTERRDDGEPAGELALDQRP